MNFFIDFKIHTRAYLISELFCYYQTQILKKINFQLIFTDASLLKRQLIITKNNGQKRWKAEKQRLYSNFMSFWSKIHDLIAFFTRWRVITHFGQDSGSFKINTTRKTTRSFYTNGTQFYNVHAFFVHRKLQFSAKSLSSKTYLFKIDIICVILCASCSKIFPSTQT